MNKKSLIALVLSLMIALGSMPQCVINTFAAENGTGNLESLESEAGSNSDQGNAGQNDNGQTTVSDNANKDGEDKSKGQTQSDTTNEGNDQTLSDNNDNSDSQKDDNTRAQTAVEKNYIYIVDLSDLGPDGKGISATIDLVDENGDSFGKPESSDKTGIYSYSTTENDIEKFGVNLSDMTNYEDITISAGTIKPEESTEETTKTDGDTEINTITVTRTIKIQESLLTIKKLDQEIEVDTTDEIVQWGDGVTLRSLSKEGIGEKLTYNSSKNDVASIDANGKITVNGVGRTTLSIKDEGNDYYNASNTVSYDLVVNKNTQPIKYNNKTFNLKAYSSGINPLTIAKDAKGEVSYSIDTSAWLLLGPSINKDTGNVETRWAKSEPAIVTASYKAGEDDKYEDATVTYSLYVTFLTDIPAFEQTELTITYGDKDFSNAITNLGGNKLNPEADIEYSVDPEGIVQPVGDGTFKILSTGTATVSAAIRSGSKYDNTFAEFAPEFTVTVNPKNMNLRLTVDQKIYGDAPFKVKADFDSVDAERETIEKDIVYTTETPDQISIEGDQVTILKAGEAKITASYTGTNTHYASEPVTSTFMISKAEFSLDLNTSKKYGQKDPDLTDTIKNQIWNGMTEVDKAGKNSLDEENEVFRRLFDEAVKYDPANGYNEYDLTEDPEGQYRPAGRYSVNYEVLEDLNYKIGHDTDYLTVEEGFVAEEDTHYTIVGLTDVDETEEGEELWGAGGDTVKIIPAAGYKISQKNDGTEEWADELIFREAQEVEAEKFFIRQMEDGQISQESSKTFGIDTEAPTFQITDINVENKGTFSKILNFLTFGIFAKEALVINVKTDDAAPASGVSKVYIKYNQTLDNTGYKEYMEPQKVDENGEITVRIPLEDKNLKDFEKLTQFAFVAEDKVANKGVLTPISAAVCAEGLDLADVTEKAGLIQIEQNRPVISVSYKNGVIRGSGDKAKEWFGGDVTFTYTVTDSGENNSGIRLIHVVASGDDVEGEAKDVVLTFKDGAGNEVLPYDSDKEVQPGEEEAQTDRAEIHSDASSYYFIDSKKETLTFKVNTADIGEKLRGRVTLKVYVTDNAGNETTEKQEDAATTIYIDRDAPSIIPKTGFTFEPANGNSADGSPVDSTSYGFFFKKDTTVTVAAKDADPSSDIKKIHFYTEDINGNIKEYKAASEGDSNFIGSGKEIKARFVVPTGFKGQIYAMPEDYVGHNPGDYVHPYGTAIENKEIHDRESAISVVLNESTPYRDVDGRKLFDHKGVKVLMTVEDRFSGIKEITWSVDQDGESKGTTTLDNVHEMTPKVGGRYDGWIIDAVDGNLITKMHRQITVSSSVNNINVDLSFKDNAGNSSKAKRLNFSIDVTNPSISVSYDNNSPDSGEYYKEDRVATVRVTERNFDASRVRAAIGSSSAAAPSIVWDGRSSGSGDSTVHTGTIRYHADSDYTFNISCTDRANNNSGSPSFAGGTTNPTKFTIDQTAPVVTVSYDNNAVANGRYFKNARVQTVRIVEHNFDVDRVTFTRTATDEGADIAIPNVSWSSSGDDHYATITYDRDGDYTFDVKVKDKAGNDDTGASYGDSAAAKSFTIDQTIKEPEIIGVEDGKSYKGDAKPGVSFDDEHFENYSIKLTRTRYGEKDKDVTEKFITAIKTNGRGGSGVFDTFEKKQENDGIYTLTVSMTDLAGNVSEKKATFTINRFGSIYVYEDYLRKLQNQYVKEVTDDIVITEINPDKLNFEKIKVEITRDGTPISSVVYSINPSSNYNMETGKSGWYEYTYTIDPSNFIEDGVYRITVSSVDGAGNTPETLNYEDGAIVFRVDRTAPEISSVVGLEKPIVNAAEQDVSFTVFDALGLQKVSVYVNGELVLETDNFEDLINYSNSVKLGQGMNQNVRIVATDLAGNTTDTEYIDEKSEYTFDPNYDFVHNITVSTNILVRWYANTRLFWSSILAAAAAAGGIFFIIAKRKKKDEEEEEEKEQ